MKASEILRTALSRHKKNRIRKNAKFFMIKVQKFLSYLVSNS